MERVPFLSARLLSTAALALSAVAVPSGLATAADGGAAVVADGASTTSARPRLPRPAHGQEAIRLLGDQLDKAAAVNGWTAGQLRKVLSTDPTAWTDQDGRVFYQDLPHLDAAQDAAEDQVEPATFPLPETFLLHSKPDSTRTLFIDFDGTIVSGTAWNTSKAVPDGDYPAWSLDGDPSTFSDAERTAIQSIWQRVAEDYAPFDIDVTTQDPGDAALTRTDLADQTYGTRALVTPSTVAEGAICGTPTPSCGGVAYINAFGEVGSSHQPAWVFPQSLGPNDTKDIAEAVSHEVGHNFSLQHDGRVTPAEGYYAGHANWAPIMGSGYNRSVTQWSKGEYASANNTAQDDVALIAQRAPYRADEAGATIATAAQASPWMFPRGYITDRNDTDTFALGTCSGSVTVSADPVETSPDLDIKLELLDSAGTVLASANPPAGTYTRDIATGLGASIATSVPADLYYVRLDGVGTGTGDIGYTDYASLGAYSLDVQGCQPSGPTPPTQPTQLSVSEASNGRSATVSWSLPTNDGGSPVSGYTLSASDLMPVDVGLVGSHTWSGLTPGKYYTFTVAATNAVGTGYPIAVTMPMHSVPGLPTGLTVAPSADGTAAVVTWTAPAYDGGTYLTGYTVTRSGAPPVDIGTIRTHTWTGLAPGATYTFTVAARNAVGTGASASKDATTPNPVTPPAPPPPAPPPPAPANTVPGAPAIGKAVSGHPGGMKTAVFRWAAPSSAGGLALTAYYVQVLTRSGKFVETVRVAPGRTTFKLKSRLPGAYKVVVVAQNALGAGAPSAASKAVRVR
jgi:hypothetical protein